MSHEACVESTPRLRLTSFPSKRSPSQNSGMGLSAYVLVMSSADGRSSESSIGIHATTVGIDPAFGSSTMVLRTARAPRLQAGHVGDSNVRNRASPLCALNAVRTAASDEDAVRSTSGALAFGFSAF